MIKNIGILLIGAFVYLGFLPGSFLQAGSPTILILCGSKYGSTEQSALWIAEGMAGLAEVRAVKEAGDISGYEHIILGSGIYYGRLHPDMSGFLAQRKSEVRDRVVALFVVSGSGPAGTQYLEAFTAALGRKPGLMRAFGGWIKKEQLSPEDFKTLEAHYKRVNRPFVNSDNTDKDACVEFGKEILKALQAK